MSRDSSQMYCRTCRYRLRDLTSKRCPECGTAFDPGDPASYLRTDRPRRYAPGWRSVIALLLVGAFFVLRANRPSWSRNAPEFYLSIEVVVVVWWLYLAATAVLRRGLCSRILGAAAFLFVLSPQALTCLDGWQFWITSTLSVHITFRPFIELRNALW